MTLADAIAGVLWLGTMLYAIFGGADFGAGAWDLLAGSGKRGQPSGSSSTGRWVRSGRPTTPG